MAPAGYQTASTSTSQPHLLVTPQVDGITTLAKGTLGWGQNANLISWIYDTHNFYCVWTANVEHIRIWHMSRHFWPC